MPNFVESLGYIKCYSSSSPRSVQSPSNSVRHNCQNKQANKQTNKQTMYTFNDIQAPGLHAIQYYNIYKIVDIMMIIIKTTKKYLYGGSCTPCGKVTHKENLEQSQNHF